MASAMEKRGKERERDVETRSVLTALLPLLHGAALRRVCSAAISEVQSAEYTTVHAAATAHHAWVNLQQHTCGESLSKTEKKREREGDETHTHAHTHTHTHKE